VSKTVGANVIYTGADGVTWKFTPVSGSATAFTSPAGFNYREYSYTSSSDRIDDILSQPGGVFEEVDGLPDRDKLSFTNGFYGMCSAVFIDIRDSSGLTDQHKRPTLAKIYRAFISEMVAVLNSDPFVREVNIVGDCVWAVYKTISDPLTLARSSILWVPGPEVPVSSCALTLGAPVTEGVEVAKLQPVIASVRVATMPTSLVPGARVVVIDGETFQVDDSGTISAPTELERFASKPEYLSSALATSAGAAQSPGGAASGSADSSGGISGRFQLAAPVEAWVVPPGALASIDGTNACVSSDGLGIAVTIVGSQLGKSYVTFDSDQMVPSAVDLAPGGVTC
jgi:hypothetical protein